jgi:hypothetical protein
VTPLTQATVLGFGSVIVREGEQVSIRTTKLQEGIELFRPKKLIIHGSRYFMVHDFSIGKDSQFAVAGCSIPAAVFSPEAVGAELGLRDLLPEETVTLVVEHIKVDRPNWLVRIIRKWLWLEDDWATSHTFSAALLGEAVMRDGYVPPSVASDGDGHNIFGGAIQ